MEEEIEEAVKSIQTLRYGRFYSTLLRLSPTKTIKRILGSEEYDLWVERDDYEKQIGIRELRAKPGADPNCCLYLKSRQPSQGNGEVKMLLTFV